MLSTGDLTAHINDGAIILDDAHNEGTLVVEARHRRAFANTLRRWLTGQPYFDNAGLEWNEGIDRMTLSPPEGFFQVTLSVADAQALLEYLDEQRTLRPATEVRSLAENLGRTRHTIGLAA